MARAAAFMGFAFALIPGLTAQPAGSLEPVVVTNTVVVTNVVLVTVTNYVVTTNVVISTNGLPTDEKKKNWWKKAHPPVVLPDLSWVPPADDFDWIQLKSGEWLKGRLKALQDRDLEFYSEELKDFTFDWKDIRQVRTARTEDVLFVGGNKLSGPVVITTNQVTVGGAVPQTFPREQLQSLTPGGTRERNYWSGDLTLGLTLREGNTASTEYNAQAHLQRRTPETRLSFDYIGNLSSIDGVQSANNSRVNAEFDRWLSQRFYLVVPSAEYYKDPFQNLAHRITLGVGLGYDLIDRPKLEWNITTGPAFQKAWFESAQPDEPTEKGSGALTLGSRFDWQITHRIEWLLEYRGIYTSKEVGETTHHAAGTLSLELTKRFDLNVSLTWDRISQTKVGADGTQPKPDDFRLVLGLGVDF